MKHLHLDKAFVFVFVCLCGTFVAKASGLEWGTPDMGMAAYLTIVFGIVAAACYSSFTQEY